MDPKRLALRVASSAKFAGRSHESWEKWLAHFELRFRDVDDDERAKVLIDLLDGTALDLCTRLTQKELSDYESVKKALQNRFGEDTVTLQAYAELSQAEQKPGEDVEEFGDRILELVTKAYPGATQKQIQDSGLKQFICGLADVKLQEKLIARDDLTTMGMAVKVAKGYRTKAGTLEVMRAKREGDVAMTTQRATTQNPVTRHSDDEITSVADMKAQLDEIQKTISLLEARVNQQGVRTSDATTLRRCYQCGSTSHLKRNCPQVPDANQGLRREREFGERTRQTTQPAFCVGCGRHGHWMAECWRVSGSTSGPRNSGRGALDSQGNE